MKSLIGKITLGQDVIDLPRKIEIDFDWYYTERTVLVNTIVALCEAWKEDLEKKNGKRNESRKRNRK